MKPCHCESEQSEGLRPLRVVEPEGVAILEYRLLRSFHSLAMTHSTGFDLITYEN